MSKRKPASEARTATLKTTREALLEALAIPARITPKKSSIEAYLYVTLSHQEGEVRIAASDMSMSADVHVAAECTPDASWRVLVMGRELVDVTRRCLPGEVELDVYGEDRVVVRSAGTEWTLPAMSAHHAVPTIELGAVEKQEVRLDSDDLAWLLATVRFAAGHDTSHPYMCGVYLHAEGEELVAVATNGHMLALAAVKLGHTLADVRAFLPVPTVETLAATLAGRGEITMRVGRRTLQLEMGPASMTCLLGDDQFPSYQKVIPAKKRARVFDAEAWSDEVSRVCLASERVRLRSESGRVSFLWSDTNGRCSAGSAELTGNHEIKVDVSSDYLLAILGTSVARPEDVTLGVGGVADPIVVRTSNERRRTIAVAMPMSQ